MTHTYTKEGLDGLVLIGRMVAREGKRDQLLQLLDEAVAVCSPHEPDGALAVIFHTSPADPDLVVLYEHYPSRASLDEHRANYERIPVYGEMRARMNALLAAPVEIVEVVKPVVRYTRSEGPGAARAPARMARYTRQELEGLVLVSRIVAHEGREPQDLLQALGEGVDIMAQCEPEGLLSFAVHLSTSDPQAVVEYSHYPSRESLEDHRSAFARTPAYAEARDRVRQLMARTPERIVEELTPVFRFSREARG